MKYKKAEALDILDNIDGIFKCFSELGHIIHYFNEMKVNNIEGVNQD